MIHQALIGIATPGRGITDISQHLQETLAASGIETGLCNAFIRHTSASLMICENADPAVLRDMEAFMSRLVSDGDRLFEHRDEGPDDMAAHVRSVLTQTSLSVPVSAGRLMLGTWQGVFLWEHRFAGHRRQLIVTVSGDGTGRR